LRDWDADWDDRHCFGQGFFTALGAYRATARYQVASLAARYDIDVEGDLATVITVTATELLPHE
jgi:hypothetical protein